MSKETSTVCDTCYKMDVTERGGKTYIKVESIELPQPGELDGQELDTIPLKIVPEEGGRTDLDVTVAPDVDDDSLGKDGTKCADRCGCLNCLFLVMGVSISVLSVVFDWLWVRDMVRADQALVFGPPGNGVLATLIIVASLGTITYLGESADKIKKFATGKEWFDEETEELGSLFLEEVPEITLNLLLAMCREVPTSYFQLIKAVLTMLSSGLRLIKGLMYLFGCKDDKKNKRRLRCSGWIILMIACVYTFATSICVFVFMYHPPDGSGVFHVPKAVIGKHYNTERYFPNAGVFFNHPSFDHCDHRSQVTPHLSGEVPQYTNWLQVEGIYSFLSLGAGKLEAGYAYNNQTGTFWVKSKLAEDCYTISLNSCAMSRVNATECDLPPDATLVFFTFIQVPKSKTLVFGDIQFNATIVENSQCSFLSSTNGFLYNSHGASSGRLHYLRAHMMVDTALPVVYHTYPADHALFYQYPQDLTNVTDAWRTGHQKCSMSGSISPNKNADIYSECVYRFGQSTDSG